MELEMEVEDAFTSLPSFRTTLSSDSHNKRLESFEEIIIGCMACILRVGLCSALTRLRLKSVGAGK